jgi:DNA-binding HxlR family transcriptional regulator
MLKIKFWKKEEPKEENKKVVLDQKSLDIGSSIGELSQKFDKLSTAIGQCFLTLDNKIDSYKDNIVVIQDGIGKQVEQHDEFKTQLESYEEKILRLLRNLRFEIETEISSTKDEGTKERLSNTIEKIDTTLILSLIKEKGPIETKALEEEVFKKNLCSKATLFRKLKSLREKGFVVKEERDGTSFYSVAIDLDNKKDSLENLEQSQN